MRAIDMHLIQGNLLTDPSSVGGQTTNARWRLSSSVVVCSIFLLLSYSVFPLLIAFFPYFFVSGPCAGLSWPSRQLLSAR